VSEQVVKRARRIIVYIATSADGYIARPDGDVGWLNRPRPKGNYGMGAFLRSIDTVLWGRKTYELGLGFGGPSLGLDQRIKNYVFSRNPPSSFPAGVEFVREPIADFVARLRSTPGKNIWMMGGAGIIGAFLDEGAIDEFSIHVIPVFIGEGIPMAEPRHRLVRLKLLSTRAFPDGVVHLDYEVPQPPGRTVGKGLGQEQERARDGVSPSGTAGHERKRDARAGS
jgi:dihydrofolate reductase